AQLRGCINDVRAMKQLLVQNGFTETRDTMVVLTDDQRDPNFRPTKHNILTAMHWLTAGCAPGDILFFHFSGHGAQQVDPSGVEEDGMDETICPCDFNQAGQISDNEIFMSLDEQCSMDANAYGRAGGAMTTAFVEALSNHPNHTYPTLMDNLHHNLRRHGFKQRPQLSSSQAFDINRPFTLFDIQPNQNPQIGLQFRKKKKPRRSYTGTPLGNMLMIGAAGYVGLMLAPGVADLVGHIGGNGIDALTDLGGGLGDMFGGLGDMFG
ncbi:hypothetical protein CYMTET_11722, partial [Cymbomonas tetramitiformis]